MYDRKKQTEYLLKKIETTLERIIGNSSEINSYQYYASSPSGMERLESTCMLLIALGESIKGVDKLTDKQLLQNYPQVDWKGAMGIRDIIAHHYFDLDAEIVYDVVKNNLPQMLNVVRQIIHDLQ
ncbi:MAG TPA: DUF86 domain-containing protein [Candidatus Coprenecus merdigallinarum]|nr:DUF86 domain-containing protein [Candidatus Coprenecus merdigallinarum]